jgi:uncharacterized phiE125 gp8 family phage protein
VDIPDYTRTVGPTTEVITTAQALQQCRASETDPDVGLLDGFIRAAREWVEQYTGRGLLTQTYKATFEEWFDEAPLPMAGPLQSVTSVKYYDGSGTLTTVSSSSYIVDTTCEPGCISRAPYVVWPVVQADREKPIEVTYVVGYASAKDVPGPIVAAMLLYIGHLYANREAVVVGNTQAIAVPFALESLLSPYRLFLSPPEEC